MGSVSTRVTDQAAFLLHSVPYRETSLVVDLFTREHGRIGAVAKGARRPHSALRGVLMQFQPLSAGWTGRNELRTLTSAQWLGGLPSPQGDALLCAFYLNELLIRLLPREDPHPALYDGYERALHELSTPGIVLDDSLRRFEWLMLRETGYAPDLQADTDDAPVQAQRWYRWHPSLGFVAADAAASPASPTLVSGDTLLGLSQGRFDSPRARTQAKYLTRAILSHHLEGAPLNTRQILLDLHKL